VSGSGLLQPYASTRQLTRAVIASRHHKMPLSSIHPENVSIANQPDDRTKWARSKTNLPCLQPTTHRGKRGAKRPRIWVFCCAAARLKAGLLIFRTAMSMRSSPPLAPLRPLSRVSNPVPTRPTPNTAAKRTSATISPPNLSISPAHRFRLMMG